MKGRQQRYLECLPTLDAVSLAASVGTIADNGDGTFTWSLPTDGTTESQTVTLTATDSDGAETTTTFELFVENVDEEPPVIESLTTVMPRVRTLPIPDRKSPCRASLLASPVTATQSSWTGAMAQRAWRSWMRLGGPSQQPIPTAQGGVYTVSATLTDDDGESTFAATEAVVSGSSINGGVLQLVGTNSRDRITLSTWRSKTFVWINGSRTVLNTSDIDRIEIVAGDGNDFVYAPFASQDITVDGGRGDDRIYTGGGDDSIIDLFGNNLVVAGSGNDLIRTGSGRDRIYAGGGNDIVFAGAGNDLVDGGSGADILLGEDGRDTIYGRSGRDLIIGGRDKDLIRGSRWNDILISGSTVYDSDVNSLISIRDVWNLRKSYYFRVKALLSGSQGITLSNDQIIDDV